MERDLREGRMTPDVADVTMRDVKERLALLEDRPGDVAESDLREWLVTNVRQVVVTESPRSASSADSR